MKIVHVSRQFSPSVGGLETVVEQLAMQQSRRGHEVTVVTLDRVFGRHDRLAPSKAMNSFRVVRIPFLGSRRYPIAFGVLRHIKHADVVHVHAIDFFFDFLAMTSWFHRRPLVVSTHGGFFHTDFAARLKDLYFNTITRFSLRRYGFVAATSDSDFMTFCRIRKDDIAVIANGVDSRKFARAVEDRRAKKMIYFGRWSHNKKLLSVLAFLKSVSTIDPGWTLVIAGQPNDLQIDGLLNEARRLGLEAHVQLVESPSDADLKTLISDCSMFVSASRHEGFGIAAIEAISAGLMPVLSNIPAHSDTVRATGIGVLADFSSPDSAARQALSAWRSWGDDRSRDEEVFATLSSFSWEAVSLRFEDIYEKIIGYGERSILGARVQATNQQRLMRVIDGAVTKKRELRLAFVNANFANHICESSALAQMAKRFYLVNDGVGIDLASFILYGRAFPENLNGTDFVPTYLNETRKKLRLFLLGGTEATSQAVTRYYKGRWPQHSVVGSHSGYFLPEEGDAIKSTIETARPDIVLVAMGNPQQEEWIAKNIPKVCAVGIGVGALFDFQVGKVFRAPALIRKCRLEWLHRLCSEPQRLWKRYLIGNALFIARVGMQMFENTAPLQRRQ